MNVAVLRCRMILFLECLRLRHLLAPRISGARVLALRSAEFRSRIEPESRTICRLLQPIAATCRALSVTRRHC